jgi:hypothetical protein
MGSFRRRLMATVGVLALLVAVFAVLTYAQGPKLSMEQIDTSAVVSKPDQTLRLFTNERVSAVTARDVAMRPKTAFTVASSGQIITIQFTEALRYSTAYSVAVSRVVSADDARSSTLRYGFRTASPPVYYLHRSGTAAPDEIERTGIHASDQTIVYSARHIEAYAVFGTELAVVTLDSGGYGALSIVGQKGVVKRITLPGEGTVDLVRGNPDTGRVGFTFTSSGPTTKRKWSNTLFSVDPAASAIPAPVKGLGGTPLAVLAWDFVPSSSDIVAQNIDQSVVLVDTTRANAVTPLGAYPELGPVSADGRSVVVSDDLGPLRVVLPTGKATRLVASRFEGSVPYSGDATAVVVPGGWLQVDSVYSDSSETFVDHLVFDDGRSARQLFSTQNPRGTIDTFAVSPNNEYVAIETTPNASTSVDDGYAVNGQPRSATTELVDVATGAVAKTVAGFDVSW